VDRAGIERHDFPTGRRGYDPRAVDNHLRRVADEFEALRAPLSVGASEQVRLILEAAERGAVELRAKAGDEAGEHVARVAAAAEGMAARIAELERELEGVRRGAERLAAGLAELQAQVQGAGVAEPLPAPDGDSDEAGARLIALNMALGGNSREETARYLAEHFALADPAALLDDVYARAGR